MNIIKAFGRFLIYILFFALTWILNLIICGIAGSFYYDGIDEFTGMIYTLSMLLLPVIASVVETIMFAKRWAKTRRAKSRTPSAGHSIGSAYLPDIDFMEGHDFEYWCAGLLRHIGFQGVTVTQGSGDQGVDILAQKDGIRYAIQCKRYSSNLGNTPVQEVHAGKMMYNCQIGAVMTNLHFTDGAKQLAAATGVLLWDRDWIRTALMQSATPSTSASPVSHISGSAERVRNDVSSSLECHPLYDTSDIRNDPHHQFIAKAQWYAARRGADFTEDE